MGQRLIYPDHIRTKIPGAEVNLVGEQAGWAAPIGINKAPFGFGDETWDENQPDTLIAWSISGGTVTAEIPGFQGRQTSPQRRGMALQPRGSRTWYTATDEVRFGHFYIGDELVARVAEGLDVPHFPAGSLRHDLIMFRDDVLWQLLDSYAQRSLSTTDPPSRIEMEARALLVVERLISAHHLQRPAKQHRGGLAPWQLKRAQEAMLAQIATDMKLDDLADIVGCSATHFSRAFKQSTGVAPFHWLADQRIRLAKEMLIDSRQSLAEIALAVGFAAQPQFTTAFGRATGKTPGAWRRERIR